VTDDPREVSALAREGMSAPGKGLTLYPPHYRAAFASSLIPSPLPRRPALRWAYPGGEDNGITSFTWLIPGG
jgi:hypothetical protein